MWHRNGTLRLLTGSVTWCTAVACPQNVHSPLLSHDHKTLGPALGHETGTFPLWTAPWRCWRWAARESLCLTGHENINVTSVSASKPFCWFRSWGGGIYSTFLLCCSFVDCWFRRLSISMSKWDVWFLLLLPFFSVLLPDVEAPTSCVLEAGVREECGGELELWIEDEKAKALLWGACSSAFLLTPARWPLATDPIMAHNFVWSTDTTTEEEEAEDEDDEVGSRTSMSSWAANFSSKLWMQLWLTGVSVCWREFKCECIR